MINSVEQLKNTLEDSLLKENINTNLSKTERILSIAGGTYIALKGLRNIFSHPLIAATELTLGYTLLNRGVSGYCAISEKLEQEPKGPEPVLVTDNF